MGANKGNDIAVVQSAVRVMLNEVKHLAKCPGKVRANERNVNLFTNFSASAAELNDRVTNVIGQVPARDPSLCSG